ncbi:hypothetical protein, partial [Bacillus spizizenii]|uniref:hypothetical protein n=1 Tax=Bacillus spizizenii TaxID=96241 RepID=UPI00284A0B8C
SVSRQGEVIPNYKNSGQTAIVWTFEDMKAGDFAPYTSKEYPQVGFTAIANDLSEEGTNINQAYLVFDDMENMGIEYKKDAQDKFDFNENSKTDDKVVYSEDYYVYVTNKEVVLTKSVQNEELAKNKVWSTDGVFVKYGEKANYKLNIKNHLDVDVPQVTVYDVLPFKGDRAIVPNDGGEYLSRESMY